jgi:hypothetical protein
MWRRIISPLRSVQAPRPPPASRGRAFPERSQSGNRQPPWPTGGILRRVRGIFGLHTMSASKISPTWIRAWRTSQTDDCSSNAGQLGQHLLPISRVLRAEWCGSEPQWVTEFRRGARHEYWKVDGGFVTLLSLGGGFCCADRSRRGGRLGIEMVQKFDETIGDPLTQHVVVHCA